MNDKIIWEYLKKQGFTDAACAGIMGNLAAESGLSSTNLQNAYEKKLGMSDETYTAAVDTGVYKDFVTDSAGYGICQWTYHSRKQKLLDYAKSRGCSIGDLVMQLDFLIKELNEGYPQLITLFSQTTQLLEASNAFLFQFERPADQSEKTQTKRAEMGNTFYFKFAAEYNTKSQLITYSNITANKTPRKGQITTITPHCIVGQWTAKQGCDYFANTKRQASANYIVGCDGSIGESVPEDYRAWTSGGYDSFGNPIRVNGISGSDNDHNAITIEVASDTYYPYAITPEAYNALIDLMVDICKRNNIPKLLWQGDKSLVGQIDKQNITVHRWFSPTACPGDYIYNRLGEIAAQVNERLGVSPAPIEPPTAEEEEEVTQEQFNKMMDAWIAEQAKKPATWEKDMEWAVANGLIAGNDSGQTMPKKMVTRGEMVTVFKRFADKFTNLFKGEI